MSKKEARAHGRGLRVITKADVKQIVEEAKRNRARLDECKGPHVFVYETPKKGHVARYAFCSLCSGKLPAHEARWYEKGLDHMAEAIGSSKGKRRG